MSEQSEATRQIDNARSSLKSAVIALNEIVLHECQGHDELPSYHRKRLRQAISEINTLREDLR